MIYNMFYYVGILVGLVSVIIFSIRFVWDYWSIKLKKAALLDVVFVLLGIFIIVANLRFMDHLFFSNAMWTIVLSFATLFYAFLTTYNVTAIYDLISDMVNHKNGINKN